MTYTVEEMPEQSAVVVRPHIDFDVQSEQGAFTDAIFEHLDNVAQPLFLIVDMTSHTGNLHEMIEEPQTGQTDEASIWQHPNLQEVILVAPDSAEASAASAGGAASTGYRLSFVETMGEAVTHIDRLLSG